MNRLDAHRAVLTAVSHLDGVCSVTLVGSAVDRDDLSTVSDIDTVVVFDRLTPARMTAAISAVGRLTGADLGAPGKTVVINSTFGPLKFDAEDRVVVHLMMYDRESHRTHVLKSPFTCLDWERSDVRVGPSLRDIYPVGRLSLRDFMSARRGLADYLNDLDAGIVTYRRLIEVDGRLEEHTEQQLLDHRHRGEYAYHILRNLIANTLKMLTGTNRAWSESELRADWRHHLPALTTWVPFFEQLANAKHRRRADFPADTVATTRAFLEAFSAWLADLSGEAYALRFYRHAKTSLNDRSFLGRRRDPGVSEPVAALEAGCETVDSSPLRRAMETATAVAPAAALRIDDRLIEIDYGRAEGLTAADLAGQFPEIVDAWARGEDCRFPDGENHGDVLTRLRAYLDSQPAGPGQAVAVTHNVLLRVLVSDLLGLDLPRAFRIPIAHLEPIDAIRIGGRWMPNWSADAKARFLDGYTQWAQSP